MKKHFKRIFTMVLAIVFVICLYGCGDKKENESAKKQTEQKDPYKVVLEELVAEYGMPTVEETTFKGVMDFEIIDLNDDDKEELFVICSKGEDNFFSAIYSVEKNKAVKEWETESSTGFDNAYIKKQSGKTCIFLTTSYRGWAWDIIAHEDGEFVNLFSGEPYNEEEQQKYDDAIQFGIGAENDAILDIYLTRIGLSLEDPWEELAVLSTGREEIGTDSQMKQALRDRATECKENLKTLGIVSNESPEEILSKIPYFGDRTKCKMDADMAKAYADAIESMDTFYVSYPGESWSMEYELCAFLADPADDGMPILITAYLNKYAGSYYGEECEENKGELYELHMWQYKDGKATDANVQDLDYSNGFGKIGGKTYYRSIEFAHDVGNKCSANYYLIENGTITLKHTVDMCNAYEMDDGQIYFYGDTPDGEDYTITSDNLLTHGWVRNDDYANTMWYLTLYDGENVTNDYMDKQHDEIAGFTETSEIAHINDLEYHIVLENDFAWNVAELLKDYSAN